MGSLLIMLNTSLPDVVPPNKNRRRNHRNKPQGDDVVTVYSSQGRWPAIIVDESEGGFGLAVPPEAALDVGSNLRVTTKQHVVKALVVSRRERDAGALLGLKLI